MENYKNKMKDGTEVEIIASDNAINNGFRKIGDPTDLEMIITTVKNNSFQSDVFLKKGWTAEELQEIIAETLVNCELKAISIKVTIKGIVSQN